MIKKALFGFTWILFVNVIVSAQAKTITHIYPKESTKAIQFSTKLANKIQQAIEDLVVVSSVEVKTELRVVEEWEKLSNTIVKGESAQLEQQSFRLNNSKLLELEQQIMLLNEQKKTLVDATLLPALEQQLADSKEKSQEIKVLIEQYQVKNGLSKKLSEKNEVLHLDVLVVVDADSMSGRLIDIRDRIIEASGVRFKKGDTLQIESIPVNTLIRSNEKAQEFGEKLLKKAALKVTDSSRLKSISSSQTVGQSSSAVVEGKAGVVSNQNVRNTDDNIIEHLLINYLEKIVPIDGAWFRFLFAYWAWILGGFILMLYVLIMLPILYRDKRKKRAADKKIADEETLEKTSSPKIGDEIEQQDILLEPTTIITSQISEEIETDKVMPNLLNETIEPDDNVEAVLYTTEGIENLYASQDIVVENDEQDEEALDVSKRFYSSLDTRTLKQLLEDENFEIKTLIIARLDPEKAATLLTTFTAREQGALISSIAGIKKIDEAYCNELDERLGKKLQRMVEEDDTAQLGFGLAMEIMNMLAPGDAEKMLENIKKSDPKMYDQIAKKYQKTPTVGERDNFSDSSHLNL